MSLPTNDSSLFHSSIQPDLEVGRYFSKDCKYYYLPLHSETRFNKNVEKILGAANLKNRNDQEIESSLLKAKYGQYSHIKIPLDRSQDNLLLKTYDHAKEIGLKIVLQTCGSLFGNLDYIKFLKEFSEDDEIEIVLDDSSYENFQEIREVMNIFTNHHVSFLVEKTTCWKKVLERSFIDTLDRVHLYFPYQLSGEDSYLNCLDSQKLTLLFRQKFPNLKVLPPKGVDLWDHRASNDFDMEPFVLPCFETLSKQPKVEYSVIIPTFNNQNHIRVTVNHLLRQDVGVDKFEIIIVDDGSTDHTQRHVLELIEAHTEKLNFKYIYFPRAKVRTMGDAQYRAGISRNLGVKNSVGEILCFLDSDIVTSSNYLSSVGENLKTWDALQARRINLKESASHLGCQYEDVQVVEDCFDDEAYWEEFNRSTTSWYQKPYNWKYVCTHSFSLRKDTFWKVGGLKKNFIFYGFEDTDLGYRLVKGGYKLHLLDLDVFHLFHENARSEFKNVSSLRHNLLSRTAQIFYLHHLDEDIFENLIGYMGPEATFKMFLNWIFSILSFSCLWKAKAPVFRSLKQIKD